MTREELAKAGNIHVSATHDFVGCCEQVRSEEVKFKNQDLALAFLRPSPFLVSAGTGGQFAVESLVSLSGMRKTVKYSARSDFMNKIKSALLFVLIFIITSISAKMISRNFFNDHKNETINLTVNSKNQISDIEKAMLDFVNTANKQLPAMIDKDTRLESVFCDKKNFVIKYTLINYELNKIDRTKFEKFLEEKIKKNICSQEDNKKFLKLGVGYYLTYFDNKGEFISKIFVNENTCLIDEVAEEIWIDNSGNYIAIFPQKPDYNSVQTKYGVTKGYSCNERIDDAYIIFSITEYL